MSAGANFFTKVWVKLQTALYLKPQLCIACFSWTETLFSVIYLSCSPSGWWPHHAASLLSRTEYNFIVGSKCCFLHCTRPDSDSCAYWSLFNGATRSDSIRSYFYILLPINCVVVKLCLYNPYLFSNCLLCFCAHAMNANTIQLWMLTQFSWKWINQQRSHCTMSSITFFSCPVIPLNFYCTLISWLGYLGLKSGCCIYSCIVSLFIQTKLYATQLVEILIVWESDVQECWEQVVPVVSTDAPFDLRNWSFF